MLSHRPASLCSLAGLYDNPMPQSTFFPTVRDYEFGNRIPWWSVVVLGREPANDEAADEQNQPQDHCRVHILNRSFLMLGDDSTVDHKVHLYLEYHSVCPLVEIGTPHHHYRCECAPPPGTKWGWGHTWLRVRGWGSPNSNDCRKSLALCLLSTLCSRRSLTL